MLAFLTVPKIMVIIVKQSYYYHLVFFLLLFNQQEPTPQEQPSNVAIICVHTFFFPLYRAVLLFSLGKCLGVSRTAHFVGSEYRLGGMIARCFGFLGCVNVLVLVYLGNRDGFGIAAH
jgi:hypothetical protein